jgi:hypothetical protein
MYLIALSCLAVLDSHRQDQSQLVLVVEIQEWTRQTRQTRQNLEVGIGLLQDTLSCRDSSLKLLGPRDKTGKGTLSLSKTHSVLLM